MTLPWPPSVNHYWRSIVVRGSVRTLLSARGRSYRSAALAELMRCRASGLRLGRSMGVRIDVYPPDRRRRDLDNLPKAILDALTHAAVWDDDSQVDDLRIVRKAVCKGGRIEIEIEDISGRAQL